MAVALDLQGCETKMDLAGQQELGCLGAERWMDVEWALGLVFHESFWALEDREQQKD